MVLEGIAVGIIAGIVVGTFRWLLTIAEQMRRKLAIYAGSGIEGVMVTFLLLMIMAALVALLLRFEPEIGGSGIPQIEGEMKGQIDQNWAKVLIGKLAGCVLAISGGLALGREGPSIQIGAMLGKGFARTRHTVLTEERMLITAGAGAGLSAAFGAPLAGALFGLEELHKNFSAGVLITTLSASVASDFVTANILGVVPVFNFDIEYRIPLKLYWAVLTLGIILGLLGALYNKAIDFMQNLFQKIKIPEMRIGIMFLTSFALIFIFPLALGSGSNLVTEVSAGRMTLIGILILFLVKYLFSTASFGSGAPGGIFLPLLVLGALIGGMYCRILGVTFGLDQKYITAFVLMAMTGYFSAIVRAPVTGIILLTEMTGNFYSLLAMSLTSLIAYVIADLLGAQPIYDQLLRKRMGKSQSVENISIDESGKRRADEDKKVIITTDVILGSYMAGKTISKINLPHGCLVVSINRGGEEIIPGGMTVIEAGDVLEILCKNSDIAETDRRMLVRCRTLMK